MWHAVCRRLSGLGLYASLPGSGANQGIAMSAKQNPTLKLGARIDEGLMWAAPFRKDDVAGRNQVEIAIECGHGAGRPNTPPSIPTKSHRPKKR